MGLSLSVHTGLERSSQTSGAHHSHQCPSLHSGHVPCAEGLVEEDWKEVLVRHLSRTKLRPGKLPRPQAPGDEARAKGSNFILENFFLTEHALYNVNCRRNGAINCCIFTVK